MPDHIISDMLKMNRLAVLSVFMLSATQLIFAGPDIVNSQQTDSQARMKAASLYARMPLAFELNAGQTDPRVKAFSRGSGYGLFLTADESVVPPRYWLVTICSAWA